MKIRFKIDKENFAAIFVVDNGFYLRTSTLPEKPLMVLGKMIPKFLKLKNGFESIVKLMFAMDKKYGMGDPFKSKYPELLDVGIMGYCNNKVRCPWCYQASNDHGEHMSFDDYKTIIDQVKDSTFQIALGGAGNPDQHPDFEKIVKYTRENDIVPNYTTQGEGLTDELVQITKENCGAVAISMYNQEVNFKALDMFINAGCKTNIHWILSNDNIDDILRVLRGEDIWNGKVNLSKINAIIFLLFKPLGRGKDHADLIMKNDEKMKEFVKLVNSMPDDRSFKVGMDSCTIPFMVINSEDRSMMDLDTCEGARYSGYITHDMKMLPCSFDTTTKNYAVDLKENTIQEAWESDTFEKFRNILKNACPNCNKNKRENCLGGCPLEPKIVACSDKH